MHELLDLPDNNIIGLHLSDTLTDDDYDDISSELKHQFEAHTTTRVLLEIEEVDGWESEEQWEDFALDVRYVQDLDKVAIVSDEVWEPLMNKIELLFPMSQIETYGSDEREDALEWIRGEMEVPGVGPGSVSDPHAGAQDQDE